MRISSNMIFERGLAGVAQQQEKLLQVQQQVASGRRVLAPSDDPVAAGEVLVVQQAESANLQYAVNRGAATVRLELAEAAIARMTNLLQDVRQGIIGAGNGAYSNADRATFAADVRAGIQEALGIANATDSEGRYLFSGYQSATVPFVESAAGIQYQGDSGERRVQVDSNREIATGVPGSRVFQQMRTGNGVFDIAPALANAGTVVASAGSVTDAAAITGHDYEISFAVTGGVTTISVTDVTLGAVVIAAQPYASGGAVSFDGVQLGFDGTPANGDRFAVTPSRQQSVFVALEDLALALENAVSDPAGLARLGNDLRESLSNVDQALEHLITWRATIGSSLREVDTLNAVGEDRSLQNQAHVSRLQDVDYAAAITELTQRQIYLEAAQKSFARIAGLSLFDMI